MPANVTWLTPQGVVSKLTNLQPVSVQLSASGDPPISYTLVDGSLPDGLFLLSNGYIYGNTSVVATTTTSNFSILASSAESEAVGDFTFIQKPITETVWKSPANNYVQTVILQSSNVNIPLLASASYANFVNYYSNSLPDGVSIIGNKLIGLITGNTNLINNTSVITASTINGDITNNVYINWNFNPYATTIYSATFFPNVANVDEGSTVLFTVNSPDIPSGSPLVWTGTVTDTGNTDRTSLQLVSSYGIFSLTGGTGTFEVTIADNELNENSVDRLVVAVRTNSGQQLFTSNDIPINNTSNNCGALNSYQIEYGIPGTYTWIAPVGISNVSVVAVGAGGGGGSTGIPPAGGYSSAGGGGGGNLAWRNNIPVCQSVPYTVCVGTRGIGGAGTSPFFYYSPSSFNGGGGGCSFFLSNTCVMAWGGGYGGAGGISSDLPAPPCQVFGCGEGGGIGGVGGRGLNNFPVSPIMIGGGGGGAGGYGNIVYPGRGGDGANADPTYTVWPIPPACLAGNNCGLAGFLGGGGGGGAGGMPCCPSGYGGGVGLCGIGPSGNQSPCGCFTGDMGSNICGDYKDYGAGGRGHSYWTLDRNTKCGGNGAVRIIWDSNPSSPRRFPDIGVLTDLVPFVWNNVRTFVTISSGTGLNIGINATSGSNVTYSINSGNFPPFANIDPSNGLITGTGFSSTDILYDFKLKATSGDGSNIVLPYRILLTGGSISFIDPSPANNSARSLFIGKSNVEIPLKVSTSLQSGVIFVSNTLPDGMFIKNSSSGGTSYIAGTPTGGTSNTLAGNVSIITAQGNSEIKSNLYLNWNLYQTNSEVYIITSNTNVIYEGNTVTYTISTFNVPNNTIVYWQAEVLEGNAFNIANLWTRKRNQLTIPSISDVYTGTATIVDGTAQVEFTANDDGIKEAYADVLNFYVSRFPDSTGTILAAGPSVQIFDSNEYGQIEFSRPGTYTFYGFSKPTNVSVVVVGSGAQGGKCGQPGGGGGGLAWRNNVTLLPYVGYAVVVGCGGRWQGVDQIGQNSFFISESCIFGGGGGIRSANLQSGGGFIGEGGGEGGPGGKGTCFIPGAPGGVYGVGGGGGGAGGYLGNGGHGANANLRVGFPCSCISPFQANGSPGFGGGGGGGGIGFESYTPFCRYLSGGGGNVSSCGLLTLRGPAGNTEIGGESYYCYGPGYIQQTAFSGGCWFRCIDGAGLGAGGAGGCGFLYGGPGGFGGNGVVRIIWGPGRFFPNTCVLDM